MHIVFRRGLKTEKWWVVLCKSECHSATVRGTYFIYWTVKMPPGVVDMTAEAEPGLVAIVSLKQIHWNWDYNSSITNRNTHTQTRTHSQEVYTSQSQSNHHMTMQHPELFQSLTFHSNNVKRTINLYFSFRSTRPAKACFCLERFSHSRGSGHAPFLVCRRLGINGVSQSC